MGRPTATVHVFTLLLGQCSALALASWGSAWWCTLLRHLAAAQLEGVGWASEKPLTHQLKEDFLEFSGIVDTLDPSASICHG